jgi:hypothetical protein
LRISTPKLGRNAPDALQFAHVGPAAQAPDDLRNGEGADQHRHDFEP